MVVGVIGLVAQKHAEEGHRDGEENVITLHHQVEEKTAKDQVQKHRDVQTTSAKVWSNLLDISTILKSLIEDVTCKIFLSKNYSHQNLKSLWNFSP